MELAAYMLSQDDVKQFPKYEKIWKEIFQIRLIREEGQAEL